MIIILDKSIEQLLLSSGFANVSCYEDEPFVHALSSALRWFGWRLTRTLLRAYIATESGVTGGDSIFSQNLLAIAQTADCR